MFQLRHKILQVLHDQHATTLQLLERLEDLLRRSRPDNPPPADDPQVAAFLSELAAVMEHEVRNHFAFEEEHLFPRFSRVSDPGIAVMLGDEHEVIRPLARRIAEVARTARAEGFTPAAWEEFHRLGAELVEREVFHIQKEEMGFLPALDQILDPEDAEALAETYSNVESG